MESCIKKYQRSRFLSDTGIGDMHAEQGCYCDEYVEFLEKKLVNDFEQSESNCNIPHVSSSLPTVQELKSKSYDLYPRVVGDASENYRNSVQRNNWIQGAQYVRKLVGNRLVDICN